MQDSNQKNRLLEETEESTGAAGQESVDPGLSLLQGEAELAYLTHEGLFISDALNEVQHQQQQAVAAGVARGQSSALGSRNQQAVGSDLASGTSESSSRKEQTFQAAGGASIMYETNLFFFFFKMCCNTAMTNLKYLKFVDPQL